MRQDSRIARLLVAVLLVLAAMLPYVFTSELAAEQTPWLWFILVVAVSGWFGGLKPGMITALPLLGMGFYLSQAGGSAGRLHAGETEVPLPVYSGLLFILAAVVICSAMQRLRMANFRAIHATTRLQDVLESTQDAVLSLDHDFRCLYANSRAGQIARKAPSLLLGKSLRTVFPETPGVSMYRELQRTLREGAPAHFEEEVELAGRWYRFDAYPAPTGMTLFVRDNTAAKDAEMARTSAAIAVKAEHFRLESVMRELPIGVILAAPNCRIELVNDAARNIFGEELAPGDDITRRRPGDLTNAEGEKVARSQFPILRTLRTGERVVNLEVEYTRPDGVKKALLINSTPLRDADGHLWGAMGTYADITSLQQVRSALRASERRLRRLFDSPAIGLISGDEVSILEANDTFLHMLGYTREDMREGRLHWADITPPEFASQDAAAIRQLTELGFARQYEKEFFAKDGRRVPVLLGTAAYEKGHWSPWICWVLDRSEKRQLETRLREAAKLESIGLLAGGIAHDFNNILTSILGNSSLAFEMLPAGHPVRQFIGDALHSTERAADLTRQLLAYAGKGSFVIRPVNVAELTQEIGKLIRTSIPRNVELVLDLSPNLPLVDADATQLQQVIMNLVINGAEAVGEAAGLVRVTVEAVRLSDPVSIAAGDQEMAQPGDYVSIRIVDNGSGMDAETLAKIFDPFFTTKFTGRGLGLAAATGIVRAHRGAIRVESTAGSGSCFEVLLPVSQHPLPPCTPGEPPPPATTGAGTVMVIDDEEEIRGFARTCLERCGYTVLMASNGRDALEIYRGVSHSICIILLDLTMPLMSGEETLANLRAINPHARILLTSGFDAAQTLSRFEGRGLAGFLQKPFTSAELMARVNEVMEFPRG